MIISNNGTIYDNSNENSDDIDSFELWGNISGENRQNIPPKIERTGSGLNETKMIPITLMTDTTTATQISLLLEMIRYCMEKSSEGKSDDNKEFTMTLHIKNRSNSNLVFSIGDEPMPAIAYEKDVYIGH